MAEIFTLPKPSDIWQFTVDVYRRPDGLFAARLVNCRASLIETGDRESGAKLYEIADILEQAVAEMRADAARLGPPPTQLMDRFDAATTEMNSPPDS